MTELFQARRESGRSDADIVFERFASAQPGDVVEYGELAERIADGLDGSSGPVVVDRRVVQRAVGSARNRILRECKHALLPVPNRGYRVAEPQEHLVVAQSKEERGRRQIRAGVSVLSNVDESKLTVEQVKLLRGQSLAMSGVLNYMDGFAARQNAQDEAIANLTRRVDNIDQNSH